MNQELGLRTLSQIMSWSDDRAREEFGWLRLMADLKYDGYRDFLAGVRFVESLAMWLQQFSDKEREIAYEFVRKHLIYISPAEMQRLVELFYPREMQNHLLQVVSKRLGVPKYRIWADPVAAREFHTLKRKTLIMALSDGARIDILRHSNVGALSNEQMVVFPQVDTEKWQDLLKNLRNDLKDEGARFSIIYLVDDFAATGTSFLRFDEEEQKWKGKLIRFRDSLQHASEGDSEISPFEDNWSLCVHHYLASYDAKNKLDDREQQARTGLGQDRWFKEKIRFSYGMVLPEEIPINKDKGKNSKFISLTDKYYDPVLRTRHTDIGGTDHLRLGYGGCALPLVFEHNTPNNSVALLWAETEGGGDKEDEVPAMRALFRRRQRHS